MSTEIRDEEASCVARVRARHFASKNPKALSATTETMKEGFLSCPMKESIKFGMTSLEWKLASRPQGVSTLTCAKRAALCGV